MYVCVYLFNYLFDNWKNLTHQGRYWCNLLKRLTKGHMAYIFKRQYLLKYSLLLLLELNNMYMLYMYLFIYLFVFVLEFLLIILIKKYLKD